MGNLKRIFVLTLFLLILIPIISSDKVTFNESDNYAEYENLNFRYRVPLNTTCQHIFCPVKLEFWTASSTCVDYDQITMPYENGTKEHTLLYEVDDSYSIDYTLSQCTCDEAIDEMTGEPYCTWGGYTHINLIDFLCAGFEPCDLSGYNDKKEYCYDRTPIYSQRYLDHLENQFCAEAGYNTYDSYFLAPQNSVGKYDLCLTLGGIDYCIDPYWQTTNGSWNGNHDYTEMGVLGQLQINDSIEYPNNAGTDLNRDMSDNKILLHLDKGSGTNAEDTSGEGNNGTLVGSIIWTGTGIIGNNSLNFQGGYVNTSVESEFDFTTEFSTSVWVNVDTSKVQNIFSKWYDGSDRSWGTYLDADEKVAFITSDDGIATESLISTNAISLNERTHIATTFNNGDKRIYINGVLAGSNTGGSPIFNNAEQLIIGCNWALGACFDGRMDEIAIWNRSLSELEIINLYSAQEGQYTDAFDAGEIVDWTNFTCVQDSVYATQLPVTGKELPNDATSENYTWVKNNLNMTGNKLLMHLNNDSSVGESTTLAYDYSGAGNNGTISEAVWNTTNKKLGSASLQFDGVNDYIEFPVDKFEYDDVSVSMWIYQNQLGQHGLFTDGYDYNGVSTNSVGWFWVIENTGLMRFTSRSAGGSASIFNSVPVPTNKWVHVVMTLDITGDVIDFYINGVADPLNTQNIGGVVYGSEKSSIGHRFSNSVPNGYAFNGTIDEVAIWDRVLSADEIAMIYKRSEVSFRVILEGDLYRDCSLQSVPSANSSGLSIEYYLDREDVATFFTPEIWNFTVGYDLIPTPPNATNATLSNLPLGCFDFKYDNPMLPNLDRQRCEDGSLDNLYSEIWNYSSTGALKRVDLTTAGEYVNVTNLTIGDINGFTSVNDIPADGGTKVIARVPGLYKVNFQISFQAVASGGLYGISISHNADPDLHRECYTRRQGTGNAGSASITCLMDMDAGDFVNVQIEDENAPVQDIDIHTLNLNLLKVTE